MTKWVTVSGSGSGKTVYHTDENCKFLSGRKRIASDQEIEFHDMTECDRCKGEFPASQKGKKQFDPRNIKTEDD